MPRYPQAQWVGADPHNWSGGAIQHRFIIIHVEQGTESGTAAWFHNPAAQVSSHFGIAKNGHLQQFVDTNQTAYAEGPFNGDGISIEFEGYSGEHLTPQQLATLRQLLNWIHLTHKTPLVLTFDPNGTGVIPHGKLPEGALSHPDCPGQNIINDVHALLNQMAENPLPSLPPSHVQRPLP